MGRAPSPSMGETYGGTTRTTPYLHRARMKPTHQSWDEPLPRTLIIVLSIFASVTALGGSVWLLLLRHGDANMLPRELIRFTPFSSFLLPGIFLAIVAGTNAVCAGMVWRRSPLSRDVMGLAGGAMTVWIAAEVALLRQAHWLQFLYGALGLTVLGLALVRAFRSSQPRHRWMATVTLGETTGFIVPVMAGTWLALRGTSDAARIAPMMVAGAVEGLVLGAAQARAFMLPLSRLRFAALTAVGTSAVWAAVLSMTALPASTPLAMKLLAWLSVAAVGLVAVGGMQWLELRRHTPHAWRWIAWTALAWILALPLSFLPGLLMDETSPLWVQLVLWAAGGLLMAYVMALITWQGARRMQK